MSYNSRSQSVLIAIMATIAVASCAAHPDDILAEDVSAASYNSYSCFQLGNEYRRLNIALADASDYQRSIRLNDIYGYMPIGKFPMPLGRMMGSDRETGIALLKGEQNATIRMALAKGCLVATQASPQSRDFILR